MPVEATIQKRDPLRPGIVRVRVSSGKLGDHKFITTHVRESGNIQIEFNGYPPVIFDLTEMVEDAYNTLVNKGLIKEADCARSRS